MADIMEENEMEKFIDTHVLPYLEEIRGWPGMPLEVRGVIERNLWKLKGEWQPIETAPKHRNDVLILSADGNRGIGWFSQMPEGPVLNIEYLSMGDLKPTLEGEIIARKITHWMEQPIRPGER